MLQYVFAWYFTILLLGWVTFPLAFRILVKLPDRGYGVSRVLGLLLWGFGFWLLGSVGVLQNHPGGILFALFLLIAASFWAGWRLRREILNWVGAHWRLMLMTEVVFLLSFTFMAIVRAAIPDATGTEKPMELAFINAVLGSQTFPPHDPWLSGYAISYYHFGYILTGMLAKLTATPGGIAFNLMLTAVFSMSASGAFGMLYNLLVSFDEKFNQRINTLLWAWFGPLFLLFVSNLEGVLEVLHQAGVGWDMAAGTSQFWAWINLNSLSNPPVQPLTWIPQRFWWWWQASRVIQDIDLLGNVSSLSPIDEFPAFSFVLGDLHPHVLVMPFAMLAVGLALNIFWGGMEAPERESRLAPPFCLDGFLVSAITLGGIAFLNTWDLPVYFALLVGAYLLWRVQKQGWGWDRASEALVFAIPLGILSLVLYTPFFISFQSQAGGILPNVVFPTRGIYLWLMFGSLFIPMFLFLLWLGLQRTKTDWRRGTSLVLILIALLWVVSIALAYLVAQTETGQQFIATQGGTSFGDLFGAAMLHRLRFSFSLLTLAVLIAAGLSFLLGTTGNRSEIIQDTNPVPFVLWMIVLGGVMVLAPEFVYLRDVFGARMNTVFKFYYQAWMLWSLAGAFGAVMILHQGHWSAKFTVVLFLLLGLVYPVLAYPERTNGFQPSNGFTLDASAYLARQAPDEATAIEWLSGAPPGVVAEAVGGQYSGYARISTLSGQPAVLGWPGHEGQWRGGYDEVGSRESDIRTLYETPRWDTALEIIQRYQIRYIFVGGLEKQTYALNLFKFDFQLQIGFTQGDVQVYRIPAFLLE